MNCPACGTAMTEMTVGNVKVQACKGGCGGLWFDEWQLGKVDQPDQSAGEALLNIPQNPAVKVDQNQRRKCPRELAGIRADYKSDAERHQAAKAYYDEMFDKQLAGMLRQDKAKLESARKIAGIFKFICPSYYIPGKQSWGAF